MKEQQFHAEIEKLFLRIEEWIEKMDPDIDIETYEERLILHFSDHHCVVISRQSAIQEIWLASLLGAYHFQASPTGWVTQQGDYLESVLQKILETKHLERKQSPREATI